MKKILIIDNHDSFVYNLVEYLRRFDHVTCVTIQNQEIDLVDISEFHGILLSPGAGLPVDYPQMTQLIKTYHEQISFFGVCLGHQAIAGFFGASLKRISKPKHGHQSQLNILVPTDTLFQGIDPETPVGRYHSWTVDPKHCPDPIVVLAHDESGNIMALRHAELPIWGVQFHPESIITTQGMQMIANWIHQL